MPLIIPERSSHWYKFTSAGVEPCFQVPKKSGDGMRDVNVRDARELKLAASVTSILKVLSKPELENWKIEQGILAALTLPRQREDFDSWMKRFAQTDQLSALLWAYNNPPRHLEDEQEFAKRVVADSQAQAGDAAIFGRSIHAAAEAYLSRKAPIPASVQPFLANWKDWADNEIEDVYACEQVVGNSEHRYAGTMDLHCRLRGIGAAVVDFKTQGVKKAPTFYPEWPMQLSAYAHCLPQPNEIRLVSVIIDSAKPGPIYSEQWESGEKYWDLFLDCLRLWKYLRNYEY